MDFSDFSSYPMVANTDYSPTNECFSYGDSFDKAYLADAYTSQPDHSLSTFPDGESFFDRPVSTVEVPAGFVPKTQAVYNATLPAAANANLTSYPSTYTPAPFGQLESFGSGFSFGPNESFEASCVSPHEQHSPTPSLCGDGPQPLQSSSPELSPRLKRESPSSRTSPEMEPEPKRPQRKRGRPRLDRTVSDSPSVASGSKCQRTSRLPHNQVERKYREGLNAELERLRRAVPTLPQADEGNVMGQPKPSKAMVLAGAIDYIKKIERERDMLREENERLRGSSQGGSSRRHGWKQRESDPVSDFLVDQ